MAFFLAVIPHGLQENKELQRLVSKFKRTMNDKDKDVRWVPPDLWHVTIQYLGDLNDQEKKDIVHFFANWNPPLQWRNIDLRVQGVGAFPELHHSRVLWFGIQKNQSLLDAQSSLRESLQGLISITDTREYNPHLTIGRFRNPLNAAPLVQLGGRKHFGDYKVEELMLLESVIQGHTTKYIPVFRKSLT